MALWTRSVSSALVVVLLAGPLGVQAKPRKPSVDAQARKLFGDGQKAYDVGEFDRALELYSEAYKLKPLPGFLFNIAQCHRQKGSYKDAAFFFGRFIDNSSPKASNIELARELMQDMKRREDALAEEARKAEEDKRLAEEKRAQEAAEEKRLAEEAAQAKLLPTPKVDLLPPPPPPPEEAPVYKKGWFWAVVGGGVAVVAAGVVTGVVLSRRNTTPPVRPDTTLPDIR